MALRFPEFWLRSIRDLNNKAQHISHHQQTLKTFLGLSVQYKVLPLYSFSLSLHRFSSSGSQRIFGNQLSKLEYTMTEQTANMAPASSLWYWHPTRDAVLNSLLGNAPLDLLLTQKSSRALVLHTLLGDGEAFPSQDTSEHPIQIAGTLWLRTHAGYRKQDCWRAVRRFLKQMVVCLRVRWDPNSGWGKGELLYKQSTEVVQRMMRVREGCE